jgi:hypothetical protein
VDSSTHVVYGHIVASDTFAEAYVVPLDAIFHHIKAQLSVETVCLPTADDISDFIQLENSAIPPISQVPLESNILDFPSPTPLTSPRGLGTTSPPSHDQDYGHREAILQGRKFSHLDSLAEFMMEALEDSRPLGKSEVPKLKRHSSFWLLAFFVFCVLGFSILFIHVEFISEKQVPQHLHLSPVQTIAAVYIVSQLVIAPVWWLVEYALDAFRWTLASREEGISVPLFLAMSQTTRPAWTVNLLRIPGRHRIWVIQRYLLSQLLLVRMS